MKLFLSVSSPFSSKFLMFDYWWLLSLTIRQFHFSLTQEIFERFLLETDSPGVAVAKTFKELLSCSEDKTIAALSKLLYRASEEINDRKNFSIESACEMALKVVIPYDGIITPQMDIKEYMINKCNELIKQFDCRDAIATISEPFIPDESTVLIHGYSRVVMGILEKAAQNNKHFTVLITEGAPNPSWDKIVERLSQAHIDYRIILDGAAAFEMKNINLVLFGAEAILENGGIINKIGTYQLAIVAKTFNVPVYVAAESYKFSSNYILGQPKQLTASNRDVTPPQYITLIFSSFIMTPSAVSDELLKRLWKQ